MCGEAVSFSSQCSQAVRGCIRHGVITTPAKLTGFPLLDTPWDEPTRGSVEFMQYITGEAFNHRPWNRFSPDALCTLYSEPPLAPTDN